MEDDHDDDPEQAANTVRSRSSSTRSRNNSSWFHNWTYAPGGFDVMGVLVS
jgi:hypothetical protein